MDPYNIPGVDSAYNPQSDLTHVVSQVAPLAPVWHGVQQNAPGQMSATPIKSGSQGVLPAIWGKVESVATETGHLAAGASSFVGNTLKDAVLAPIKLGESLGHGVVDRINVDSLSKQSGEMSDRLDNILSSYKSGQISTADYLKALNAYSQDSANLSKQLASFDSKTSIDQKNATLSAVNVAGDVVTIMTFGAAAPTVAVGTKAATETLTSAAQLAEGAAVIGKLASSESAWKAASPLAQQALKLATTQVLESAGKQATAQQISRAVATNVLLKFPLTYNAISGTGQQIYDELNNAKYGDAVKTIAFNAALLFAGGPIGWGIKNASKALKATSIAAGLRPGSILDELSSRIGTGDRRALAQIAAEQVKNGSEKDVKSMIVALETNLKAANGNSAGAVNKITDHLENYIGWGSMKNLTHQEAWDNIVNYFKHSEGLDKLKKAGAIEGMSADDTRAVVPGRFTTQDKNAIALADSWDSFVASNPNSAAANNVNLAKQIGKIFDDIKHPEERRIAINRISSQSGLEGIPKDYAKQMAKDGYVAIIPQSHNLPVVPFEETSGKLATAGAEGDFFTHAAAPIPVLKSVGNFLVNAGLSPEVANQRVGEVFGQNLAQNLKGTSLIMHGDSAEQTTKDITSKLYNYMKSPTQGLHIGKNYLPITDMRQLTTKDVMTALNVGRDEARTVQDAIMQAHLDVPRQVVGLGTKIMDANFKYNPLAAPYSKIQGAFRFSWNPVFTQGKLPIKAEILSQMETGGKFPTIAGTNTFMKLLFPGQYREIDGIVDNPAFKKLMPGGVGGEGADMTGTTEAASHFKKNALRPVAGLIKSMASNMGIDAETLISQYPEKVTDAATAILHYDRKAGFLNSPMAKTLNMAFFPFRFNVKVTGFMARFLAKQEPVVQFAAVKGMMDAHQFLNSPQGQAWYSQNSDAIGLFKYFSPIETISVISNALGLKHDSTAQYGELGGLPFGVIPMMLDSAGLTHFGTAYVNPKTGAIAKDYVPTSAYGAANAAIQDLLGSLFTWPGATAGLPSKGGIDRNIVGGLLPGSKKDFNAVTPTNVTPEEQQFSQNVQAANGTTTPVSNGPSSLPTLPSVHVPTQPSPLTTPRQKPGSSAPKKKKGDFTPALLPGQSTLGQL